MNVINVIQPYWHRDIWVFDDPRVGLSAEPFQHRLEWRRDEGNGNVYYSDELGAEGWLCPALLRYFDERAPEIYVQVRPRTVSS